MKGGEKKTLSAITTDSYFLISSYPDGEVYWGSRGLLRSPSTSNKTLPAYQDGVTT